ncbi:MAG TPA: hypothetical protein VNZ05_08525 [Solirubrobacteraceae bacterium]|nr:hypothetical protein [Solirubrobacteraceae bacterium]
MRVTAPEREASPPSATALADDRCYGELGHAVHELKVDSARFAGVSGREHIEIYSNVEVLPTAAIAAKNDAANAGPRALFCAEHFLPQVLARQGGARIRYGPLSIARIPVSLPGGYGWSVTVSVLGVPKAIEPTQPHLYMDGLAFLTGRTEVGLVAVAYPRPASAAVESRLVSLLYSRASAHTL